MVNSGTVGLVLGLQWFLKLRYRFKGSFFPWLSISLKVDLKPPHLLISIVFFTELFTILHEAFPNFI